MATFQGEKYVVAQLRSILSQLGPEDEIVIVDDASTDQTCALIRACQDSRIQLRESPMNRGVLAAFAETLQNASGGVILLSDQDDLWEPSKVQTVLQAFHDYPEARLVVSDAVIIGQDNQILAESYYAERGKFTAGLVANFIRCEYLGCVMAFRSELLPEVLPFPVGYDVFHDIWIGMRNEMSGGGVHYIAAPLVRYRRHSANLSGGLSWVRRVKVRLHLLTALLVDAVRRTVGN